MVSLFQGDLMTKKEIAELFFDLTSKHKIYSGKTEAEIVGILNRKLSKLPKDIKKLFPHYAPDIKRVFDDHQGSGVVEITEDLKILPKSDFDEIHRIAVFINDVIGSL